MTTIRTFAYEHRWVLALFAVLMVFSIIGLADTADASFHMQPGWTAHQNGICETHGVQISTFGTILRKHSSVSVGFYEQIAQWEWIRTSHYNGYWVFRGYWNIYGC